MGEFFNQYSFLIVSIGLALVAALILLTNKPKWKDYLAFGVIVGGLVTVWTILHPRQTPLMEDARQVTHPRPVGISISVLHRLHTAPTGRG